MNKGDRLTVNFGDRIVPGCIVVDYIENIYPDMTEETLFRVKVPGQRKFVVCDRFQIVTGPERV